MDRHADELLPGPFGDDASEQRYEHSVQHLIRRRFFLGYLFVNNTAVARVRAYYGRSDCAHNDPSPEPDSSGWSSSTVADRRVSSSTTGHTRVYIINLPLEYYNLIEHNCV